MKKYLTIILLIGFVGMSLLGFIGMPHQMSEHSGSDCLASLVVGKSLCPEVNNSFSYAFYHIQAYQFFSNALITSFGAILAVLALAFILSFVLKDFFHSVCFGKSNYLFEKRMIEISDSLRSNLKDFIRWLSLLENSPSI